MLTKSVRIFVKILKTIKINSNSRGNKKEKKMKELPKPYILIHPILSYLLTIVTFGIFGIVQVHKVGRYNEAFIDMMNDLYQKISNK